MNPKTRYKLIFGGVGVLLITASVVAIRLADHSLTAAGAKRLPCADADYVWVSKNEIVTFTTKPAILPVGTLVQSGDDPLVAMTAERANIASGGHTTMSGFNGLFPALQPNKMAQWTVSPDEQQLLCGLEVPGRYYEDSSAPFTIWSLRTSTAESVDTEVYAGINYYVQTVAWMPDSHPLIIGKDETGGTAAAILNTESTDDSTVATPLAFQTPTVLGVTADNRLIYTDWSDHLTSGFSIFEQGIYPSVAPQRKFTPKLPADAVIREITLSPHGDKLAFAATSIHTPPGYHIIQRIAPALAKKLAPRPAVSIYLCKLDGTQMRLLGIEDCPLNAPEEEIKNVRWRPDAKYLSYRWHHGIYSVPVE